MRKISAAYAGLLFLSFLHQIWTDGSSQDHTAARQSESVIDAMIASLLSGHLQVGTDRVRSWASNAHARSGIATQDRRAVHVPLPRRCTMYRLTAAQTNVLPVPKATMPEGLTD